MGLTAALSVSVPFRVQVSIYSSSVFMVNVPLNIHFLDISSFAVEKSDLGGDDCEEASRTSISRKKQKEIHLPATSLEKTAFDMSGFEP